MSTVNAIVKEGHTIIRDRKSYRGGDAIVLEEDLFNQLEDKGNVRAARKGESHLFVNASEAESKPAADLGGEARKITL